MIIVLSLPLSTATSIPTFVIGVEKFSNGRNRIVIDITHSQHGTASISMDIPNLNIPVTPPPPRMYIVETRSIDCIRDENQMYTGSSITVPRYITLMVLQLA